MPHFKAFGRTLRILIWAASLVALAIATLAAHDRLQSPAAFSYDPVPGTTALDRDDLHSLQAKTATMEGCDARPQRWMVIGWDGASWNYLLPLLKQGKMPNLARLIENGTVADLHTFEPTASPAIWTTIATGVSPERHGILHFYDQMPRFARWLDRLKHFGKLHRDLFDNTDRRAPAAWNLLSEHRRSVLVAGYHNTFPVEPVDGIMLSNYLVQEHIGEVMKANGVEHSKFAHSLVYPASDLEELREIQAGVQKDLPTAIRRLVNLDDDELPEFMRLASRLRLNANQRPYFATRAWMFDEVYFRAVETFYPQLQPDVLFLHFQGIDWASHYFLYSYKPHQFDQFDTSGPAWKALDAVRHRYADTVEAFYEEEDRRLGELLAMRSPDTAIMVLSDHGFEPADDPEIPGFHDDAPPGILVMQGPGIRAGIKLPRATVYDILPTLMASLDLPVARDLDGRILKQAFCPTVWKNEPPVMVASYGTGPYVPKVARPGALEDQLVDQLESLGYLD
jgi:hypothetical protein